MVWTRTERAKPRGWTSPTSSASAWSPSAASTRSLTRISQSPASLHRRAARLVTLPIAA